MNTKSLTKEYLQVLTQKNISAKDCGIDVRTNIAVILFIELHRCAIELYENAEFYADHPALLDASDQIGKEVAYLFPDIVCSKGWDDDTFTKDGRKAVVEAEAIRLWVSAVFFNIPSFLFILMLHTSIGVYLIEKFIHEYLYLMKSNVFFYGHA